MTKIANRVYECRACGNQITEKTNHKLDMYPTCVGKCRHIINPHTSNEIVMRKQTAHKYVREA